MLGESAKVFKICVKRRKLGREHLQNIRQQKISRVLEENLTNLGLNIENIKKFIQALDTLSIETQKESFQVIQSSLKAFKMKLLKQPVDVREIENAYKRLIEDLSKDVRMQVPSSAKLCTCLATLGATLGAAIGVPLAPAIMFGLSIGATTYATSRYRFRGQESIQQVASTFKNVLGNVFRR